MKAIRVHAFGEPEVMRLEEVPDPKPGPGQVVVRIHAVGVNPVEAYIRAGLYNREAPLPYTPGTDAAGVIEAVGEGTSQVQVGNRVYTAGTITGAYAERALCTLPQVHPLPERISFAQGAAVYIPYATAYRALFQRAQARAGETVLVHGASGGVGIAAVQIARAAGLTVIGTAGTDRGRQLVLEQGAHHVFDHRTADYLTHIHALTDARGVDVILEMLANVNLGKDLTVLAKQGRVVVIGSRGSVQIDPRDTMTRDASILGMLLFNVTEPDSASIHAALYAGLENGTLRPVVGQELPLAQASRAHQAVMESGAHGKIVLKP
ncbi:MAG TPA: NADPH:quinone reductase [Nitrospiraceae bacterium]|nr:NADPH:quinone reductase [Nitrospiraceae bacterium]